ncbi:calponin homology domain-containing protein DDB_G0272472-like [Helianthus annuus]|uniref:calponin homology domain-containing protein DDB_G0272472-like n=1 Tax=Helianthus annuus TaxID=4232 RepID=UPI000B90258F|nr:calponin homology domain-containing protein DDB_G0272472-like [Helianthus annuus]
MVQKLIQKKLEIIQKLFLRKFQCTLEKLKDKQAAKMKIDEAANMNESVEESDTQKKKSPPHLVDDPVISPQEVIDQRVDLLKMSFADYEKLSTAQDAAKTAENVEAGGESLKETFVEGEVHTDSSETESDTDPTKIAPTSYISGKFKLKKSPKKKKASDEEDATYEPTPVEKEKLKKKEEAREKTPDQPPKTTEEPSFASKKPPTPQSSSHCFPKVPYDLPSDFGDMFNDGKINALTRKVSLLLKAKAEAEAELKATKEKLKDVEDENVALRNEVEELTNVVEELAEKIMEINAQYKEMDNSHKTLTEIVGDLHTSTSTYDEIEIQRVEARRIEREKRIAEEAAEALKDKRKGLVIDTEEILGSTSQPEPSQADAEMKDAEVEADIELNLAIIPVGEVKDVVHSEFDSLRRIEVERLRLKAKMNKYKVDDDDEELKEMFGDEDEVDDDKDDKDNKDDKYEKGDDDDHNGATEEEGELVENWTRESMLDRLDMEEDRFKFDVVEEIPPTPEREYTFKFVNEADNFNNVIIEEGSDSDEDTPFHYSGLDDDFPTFSELFRSHNEEEVRRKVVEKIATEGVPETVSKEDFLKERKRWFKVMPKERKFKRPLVLHETSR